MLCTKTGEKEQEVGATMAVLRTRGVGAILDYAAEDDSPSPPAAPSTAASPPAAAAAAAAAAAGGSGPSGAGSAAGAAAAAAELGAGVGAVHTPSPQQMGRKRAVARTYPYESEQRCDRWVAARA